jgi:hypothetical protein
MCYAFILRQIAIAWPCFWPSLVILLTYHRPVSVNKSSGGGCVVSYIYCDIPSRNWFPWSFVQDLLHDRSKFNYSGEASSPWTITVSLGKALLLPCRAKYGSGRNLDEIQLSIEISSNQQQIRYTKPGLGLMRAGSQVRHPLYYGILTCSECSPIIFDASECHPKLSKLRFSCRRTLAVLALSLLGTNPRFQHMRYLVVCIS